MFRDHFIFKDNLCEFLDQLWHTHILFFGMNDANEFVDANTAFCALSGYSQNELTGAPLNTIFELSSHSFDNARARFHPMSSSLQDAVCTIVRKNKSRLQMHLFAECIVDSHDNRHKVIMLVPTSELTMINEQLQCLLYCLPSQPQYKREMSIC